MENPYKPKAADILRIRQETKTEKTFVIALENGTPQCQCGQFYEFSLPGVGEAPFSVSYIGDGFIEMTVRKAGRVSEAMYNLEAKDKVFLRGPYGMAFPLEEFLGQELAVIAGGTGAAPVRAIIRKIEEGKLKVNKLKILLGFRDSENILFKDEIKRWQEKFSCRLSLDYPPDDWTGLKGFINQHLDKLKLSNSSKAVVVGPAAMIRFVADELMEEGLDAGSIWVSLERLMQCGIGKCGHCRIQAKYVCCDGPVFNYKTAKDLID